MNFECQFFTLPGSNSLFHQQIFSVFSVFWYTAEMGPNNTKLQVRHDLFHKGAHSLKEKQICASSIVTNKMYKA